MNEQGQHYFTAEPSGPEQRRRVSVRLGGREVSAWTSGGVFSSGRLDLGTSVLLDKAPQPPESGTFLDLGCGWGPVALTLALESPDADVWALDVNSRALGLLRDTAAELGLGGIHPVLAADVPGDLGFDLIWSNPPIRIGKPALHELLTTWLPRLNPGGEAFLVVQRNLGADSLQSWLIGALGPHFSVSRYASAKGFRILHIERCTDDPSLAPSA